MVIVFASFAELIVVVPAIWRLDIANSLAVTARGTDVQAAEDLCAGQNGDEKGASH